MAKRGTPVQTHAQAAQGRLAGLTDSGEHAEHVSPGWIDEAIDRLAAYARDRGPLRPFLAEDFREWSGITSPGDERAWGAVMQKARRLKVIVPIGYAPSRASNLSPKVLWQAAENC